ncbi:MAG: hypothetical protein WCE81_03865 [Halobacteriota archaeon]
MVRLLTYLESLEPLGKNGGMVERNIWTARDEMDTRKIEHDFVLLIEERKRL